MSKSSSKKKKSSSRKKPTTPVKNTDPKKQLANKPTTSLWRSPKILFAILGLIILGTATVFILFFSSGNGSGEIAILNPIDGAVFPPEMHSPHFRWTDNHSGANSWHVTVAFDDNIGPIQSDVRATEWKPEKADWESIKARSTKKQARVTITGMKKLIGLKKIISSQSIAISTSRDSVGAPIFYRDIPIPFSYALQNLPDIRWRLGDVSSEKQASIVLENLPVCANCHSFSTDGKFIGMDVDYANDKGSYAIAQIEKEIALSGDKIITWSDYKRDDGQLTFGLLSQVSPDGRYAISTVKDRSIFVPKEDLEYSQLFFPIKGILVLYDRITNRFWSLPGADNPAYVQSNPSWSPDGKHLIFARSRVYQDEEIIKSSDVVLNPKLATPFTEGRQGFRFDLYRIPLNEGRGGKAEPIAGASHNGMSNFFARYSPDGKWIVFTQAKNFMLLQPDSRLYIMPSEGGTPREMQCNTSNMNSWHSWSPNGKWLVFSSKVNGPYTQLFITHIDENGNDTPPVLLENLTIPNRAANIPEFVNIQSGKLDRIFDNFSNKGNYLYRTALNELNMGNQDKARDIFQEALHMSPPNDADMYTHCGHITSGLGQYEEAYDYYDRALNMDGQHVEAQTGKGYVRFKQERYQEALALFNKAIAINPDYSTPYRYRAVIYYLSEKFKESFEDVQTFQSLGGSMDQRFYDELVKKLKSENP